MRESQYFFFRAPKKDTTPKLNFSILYNKDSVTDPSEFKSRLILKLGLLPYCHFDNLLKVKLEKILKNWCQPNTSPNICDTANATIYSIGVHFQKYHCIADTIANVSKNAQYSE